MCQSNILLSLLWLIIFSCSETVASSLILGDGYIIPWAYHQNNDPTKPSMGITKDVAKAIGKELKKEIEFSVLPYARLFQRFKDGVVDLNISIDNPAIDGKFTPISPPLLNAKFYMYSHKDRPIIISNLTEIKRIGVMRGSVGMYESWQIKHNKKLTFVEVSTFYEMIEMLHLNRLDGIIVNNISFEVISRKLGFKESDYATAWLFLDLPWVLKLSKKSQYHSANLLKRLQSAVIKLKKRNAFKKIATHHAATTPNVIPL